MVSSIASAAVQPYKYNAKELDRMHGLTWYDYGARMYDPQLCRFTSPDRFADKAPQQSVYAYPNNPVSCVDVNGDTIMIMAGKEFYSFDLSSGAFINKNGCQYDGDDTNIQRLTNALNELGSTDTGACLLENLSGEKNVLMKVGENYENSENGPYGDRFASKVYWNSIYSKFLNRPSFIALGHEFAHSWDRIRGTMDRSEWFSYVDAEGRGCSVLKAEIYATFVENKIRAEVGLSLRKYYAVDRSGSGAGPVILDGHGRSIYYDFNGNANSNFRPIRRSLRYRF